MDPSFERAGERFRRVAPKFFVPTLRVQGRFSLHVILAIS
jgi:hypothetical protein